MWLIIVAGTSKEGARGVSGLAGVILFSRGLEANGQWCADGTTQNSNSAPKRQPHQGEDQRNQP